MSSNDNQRDATPGNDQGDIMDYFTGGPTMLARRLAEMSLEEVERLRAIRERLAATVDASRESGGGVGVGGVAGAGEGGGGGSADASRESGGGVGGGGGGEGGGTADASRERGGGMPERPCQCRACKMLCGEEVEEGAGGRYTLCKIEFR
ncbi:uncharacterized protein PAC_16173 [Phialocephala subalpina]|uniref:Uncharacterized protein n=1 Tax=Phialocephala subalpina TaxID=576137 RepID=A0A1L7XMK7_9HELO|nr:uncharacterized protein PAC_16173 [Phialocephala subalpina]